MTVPRPDPYACRAAGFTLLEMAVTVSVLGVLAVVASSLADGFVDVRARARAQAEAEVARQAVIRFVLQHKRLPCPDLSANGGEAREGLSGSCPATAQVGWLPYESLGLASPQPGQRSRYAVLRHGADLVAPPVGAAADFDGIVRLRATLATAAQLPPSSERPYLTGRGTPADPETCSHVTANPAFVLIAPVGDRDDAGGNHPGFDGVNGAMAESGSTYCIAAPGRAMDAGYDDVVLAESPEALLGLIAATAR